MVTKLLLSQETVINITLSARVIYQYKLNQRGKVIQTKFLAKSAQR